MMRGLLTFGSVVSLLGMFLGFLAVPVVSAQQCTTPVYCVGPCGTISHTCSCIKQSCYMVTPSLPTCRWGSGQGGGTYVDCEGPIDSVYGGFSSCYTCLYCTTFDDTFDCALQGTYVDPCYTGDCNGVPNPTPDPNDPPPPPGVGWCTVTASAGSLTTGQDVTVSLQASSQNAGGNTAYLKVVRRDHTAIAGLPAEANNEYTIASCSSTTNICSTGTTRTLPTGEYFFYCGYEAGAPSCSGNPFCDYESVTPVVTGGGTKTFQPSTFKLDNLQNITTISSPQTL